MVNVRLKKSEVARIDSAADKLGMSRSAFIRHALTKALTSLGDEDSVTGVQVRGKADSNKPKYPHETCPTGPQCQFIRTPTGTSICRTCTRKR